MITIKNINIEFDRMIISNAEVTIADSSITAITGKSGSGKTSLLYLLGLISSNSSYEYTFDGNVIDLNSDSQISQFRKSKISYIFQDNTLIDSLSVKENINLVSRIAGRPATDAEIEAYLRFVELDIDSSIYPKKLSGGEQQRVAVACAIAKNPDLIIADEPTSALDRHNADIIIRILQKYAHECGKKVVIATHNDYIRQLADRVYEIRGQKIIEITDANNIRDATSQNVGNSIPAIGKSGQVKKRLLGIRFFLRYTLRSSYKMRFQRTLMLMLCALAISFTVVVSTMGDGFIATQNDLMNQVSDREILLVNLSVPSDQVIDYDENLSITAGQVQQIENLEQIESCSPYFEFRSTGFLADQGEAYSSASITVSSQDKTRTFRFENANSESGNVIVAPYYPGQKFDKQVGVSLDSDSSGAIYISQQLAELLEIDDSSGPVSLVVSIGVPVATTLVELSVSSTRAGTRSEDSSYQADIDCSVIKDLSWQISGVLNTSVNNTFSSSGNNVIYVPIEQMKQILHDAQTAFVASDPQINADIATQEWRPSAYVIYARNYNDLDSIIRKISAIDSNFVCKSNFQDIESMNMMITNVKNTVTWISIIVLAIFILLMTIIFVNYVLSRKFETAVLKANGLTAAELLWLVLTESMLYIVLIFFVSTIFSVFIASIINALFNTIILSLSWITIAALLAISVVAILPPTMISTLVLNRVKPDRVFRN